MNTKMPHEQLNCDLCVVGGGLAGSFAALAAARDGAKVVLIQDRPMLGGNASSEIRMWVRGARGVFDRETGLISEFEERNIHGNATLVRTVSDAILYGMLRENPNIRLLLNASCMDAEAENGRIISVTAWQTTTYTFYTVKADIYADCSGDSVLAPLVGANFRKGREAKSEFGETLAQDVADDHTMGNSILLCARETDRPVRFVPPNFASYYPDDTSFQCSGSKNTKYAETRAHEVGTNSENLWWIELGGMRDTLKDAEEIRDQLMSNVYGVWDHIKNQGDHGKDNWELDWIGCLPGKRESRRYVGKYIMREQDILSGGHFEDEIAFGGWPLDDHNPYGMEQHEGDNAPSVVIPLKEIYGIPYRSLVSDNIENLMFAGRNISVTHVALSSTRVMATCALLGQALGTGAAMALRYGCTPAEIYPEHIKELQQNLLASGVFLPHVPREISSLTQRAKINLTSQQRDILMNGWERPRAEEGENGIQQSVNEELCFTFEHTEKVERLRLQFDPDFSRETVTEHPRMRLFAMKINEGKDFSPVKIAATIVKSFVVYADGEEVYRTDDNYLSLVWIPINREAKEIRVKWLETYGASQVTIFGADLIP